MKIIILVVSAVLLTGCGILTPRTEIVTQKIPILYCPAPNWKELNSPFPLAIETITQSTPAGEVAQRYNASIVQLRDYSKRLERMLQQYDITNAAYDELRDEFLQNSVTNP